MTDQGRVRFNSEKGGNMETNEEESNKWTPHNRKKLSDKEVNKMAPQLRSKYLAYEEPPKLIADQQNNTKKRIFERIKRDKMANQPPPEDDELEKIKHEKLIGQLKAAEARNRIRIMRLRYEANRTEEVNHLVACQPTAATAVRLQALLPVKRDDRSRGDTIDKISRDKIEKLMDDNLGILTGRT